RMLARDPEQRFPTAGAARDALQEFLFEARQRVTANDLGSFLQQNLDTKAPAVAPGESGLIMIGENTKAKQREAQAMRAAVRAAAQEPAMIAQAQEIADSGPFIEDASLTPPPPVELRKPSSGDAELVGEFGDMTPARLFARLASERATGWTDGKYRFCSGRTNERESFPLGLDAFEILGAGVAGMQLPTLRARLDRLNDKKVRRIDRARPTPEHFRVGAGPRELWQRLDGKRTVAD